MKRKTDIQKPAGFTLVELLVVIVIIATLAGIVFSVASRMKKQGIATKNLQTMRQVGIMVANYSSENSGNLPPIRTDLQKPDGSYSIGDDWIWIVMRQLYPDLDKNTMGKTNWWKANKPMMYNSLIVNNLESGKFQAGKNGHGINTVIAGEINGWAGSWTPGDSGYQTRPVPISKVPRPSRTVLFISAPDYNFTAGMFDKPEYKPLMIDGRVPAYFVDGHAESLVVKQYTKLNYDFR
ncbi:type II secretion system protein [bacterium]|nr:type II secretion system protein [bacterium]